MMYNTVHLYSNFGRLETPNFVSKFRYADLYEPGPQRRYGIADLSFLTGYTPDNIEITVVKVTYDNGSITLLDSIDLVERYHLGD
jgi:hypothetical protein